MFSSQASNWSEGRTVSLEEIHDALDVLTAAAQCETIHLESCVTKNWSELSQPSKRTYKAKLNDLIAMVYSLVAPGQEEKMASTSDCSSEDNTIEERLLSTVTDLLKKQKNGKKDDSC